MVVVTESGEHLVEVRGRSSAETARLVRARAGEITELEYWTPASIGGADGVLVRAPARRRMGAGHFGIAVAYLALAGATLLANAAGLQPTAALLVALLMIVVVATVSWSLMKRRIDRRYRAAVSYEADSDARASDVGMFLGDGVAPSGSADGSRGLLVVTATAARDYTWNGTRIAAQPTTDPNAWLPWPALSIDGVRRPFGWRTWCYRLPPGEHEVTVVVRAPGLATGQGCDGAEPTTVRVRIAAGQVTRLDLRVRATIEVRATFPDRSAPTEVTRFTAAVDAKVST
ncbi:hypothetical protein [Nonomuraea jiangxiensis]|nr:hypothetical protein [Nonomuraea jiangxiensis]